MTAFLPWTARKLASIVEEANADQRQLLITFDNFLGKFFGACCGGQNWATIETLLVNSTLV